MSPQIRYGSNVVRGLVVKACADDLWTLQRCTMPNAARRGIPFEQVTLGRFRARDKALEAARAGFRHNGLPIIHVDPPGAHVFSQGARR